MNLLLLYHWKMQLDRTLMLIVFLQIKCSGYATYIFSNILNTVGDLKKMHWNLEHFTQFKNIGNVTSENVDKLCARKKHVIFLLNMCKFTFHYVWLTPLKKRNKSYSTFKFFYLAKIKFFVKKIIKNI